MTNGTGVKGEGLWGVEGIGPNGIGVKGSSTHYYGVYGDTTNGHAGVYGSASATGNGVEGVAGWPGGKGVYGVNHNIDSAGVYGEANATGAAGVYGKGTNNAGVYGLSTSGIGVWGASQQVGVHGEVAGNTAGRVAVRGVDNGADKSTGYAGLFSGNVAVEGTLLPTLAATQIDHPLDPANKTLRHAYVQSPDMMSVYNGNVTTDANGDATVTLPAYFEALNQDYRYQLTVIGQFAQAIVAEEIFNNQFKIKTDLPNVKVSWQVTGIRHDTYAVANPIVVESNKPAQVLAQSYLPAALAESPAMQSVPAEVLRQPTATQP
ncbi:MAG: hypothetical protein IPK16_07035 [Anaerolineales bacterium]|nr:hypothetical protein [Anaerolineales bacterium]